MLMHPNLANTSSVRHVEGMSPCRRRVATSGRIDTVTSPREQIESTLAAIAPLSQTAMQQAREPQAQLTQPAGALGVLEEVSIPLAGLSHCCPPPAPPRPPVAALPGAHGVLAQGVSPDPQSRVSGNGGS